MKISIIVPTYNGLEHLKKLINSVIVQSYTNWELIIVDDFSQDNTISELKELQSDKVKIFERSSKVKGACSCRNEGLIKSEGELIIFLDSDDLLMPWCLEQRMKFFKTGDFDFIVTNGILINPNSQKYFWNCKNEFQNLDRFFMLDSPWSTTGPTFRKSWLIENSIIWDLKLNIWQDVDFHISILFSTNNYKVFWDSKPDYSILVNEKDSLSRVDYFNIKKIKSQFYFVIKHFENNKTPFIETSKAPILGTIS